MEAASIVASIVTSLGVSNNIVEELQLRSSKNYEAKIIALNVSISLQKMSAWQAEFRIQEGTRCHSARLPWGDRGWTTIQKLLDSILENSKDTEHLLCQFQKKKDHQSGSVLRRAIALIDSKRHDDQYQGMRRNIDALNLSIDELRIYSEIVFHVIHGYGGTDSDTAERHKLLKDVIRSRYGSLRLFEMCATQDQECALEMDLFNGGVMGCTLLEGCSGSDLQLTYHLLIEQKETELRRLDIMMSVEENDMPNAKADEGLQQQTTDFQMFAPNLIPKTIRVHQTGAKSACQLHIHQPPQHIIDLDPSPKTLADILADTAPLRPSAPAKEYLSISQKTSLAYKIVESGFFLLGTPWFAYLNSTTVRRVNTNPTAPPVYIFNVQTLSVQDLLGDDPYALSETTQLYRVGVLLMEIALETPNPVVYPGHFEDDPGRVNKLALVEREMGAQYCEAMAFCLLYRRRFYRGWGRFEGREYVEWEEYMVGVLGDYYTQVLVRLRKVRDIYRIKDEGE